MSDERTTQDQPNQPTADQTGEAEAKSDEAEQQTANPEAVLGEEAVEDDLEEDDEDLEIVDDDEDDLDDDSGTEDEEET